jgi:hypothetical protein
MLSQEVVSTPELWILNLWKEECEVLYYFDNKLTDSVLNNLKCNS